MMNNKNLTERKVRRMDREIYERLEGQVNKHEICLFAKAEDYKELIDLALDTRDFEWAKQLVKEYNKKTRRGNKL